MAEKRESKEKASPLRGEARGSGAGELLCSVTSCSGTESEGGGGAGSTESEGSSEGSGLTRGGGEGYFLAIGGAAEAHPYGRGEQSEGRSESTNRSEHDNRAKERGERSPLERQ